jgi:3-methyladenine DNA glycosylase/8-oxoguanine DNA glycosylase
MTFDSALSTQYSALSVTVPADFSFAATIDSHGWLQLPPYRYDESTQTLHRLHRLEDGTLARLAMTGEPQHIRVEVDSAAPLTPEQQTAIQQSVRRIFALDWNLAEFYAAMRDREHYRWIEAERHGRMLVCPTVWEDLVKTLLTTNTTWAQTINMSKRLCAMGDAHGDGYAFPVARQLIGIPAEELAAKTGTGYRAAYLLELAQKIVAGDVNVETWYELPSDELYKAIRSLKGFGDYAAGTMLRLLGHFDRLAIDTVARAAYKRITAGETATDKEIQAYYEPFGRWRGMALWMDCIRSDAMVESMLNARKKS